VILKTDDRKAHVQHRIGAAQRAFHGLQGAGLNFDGLELEDSARLFSVGIRTVLLYGCETLHMRKSTLKNWRKHRER
jgi:hypothetical protein